MNVNTGNESETTFASSKLFSTTSYAGSVGNSYTPFDFNNRLDFGRRSASINFAVPVIKRIIRYYRSRVSGTNFSSSPLASGSGIGTKTNTHHLNVSFSRLQSPLSNTL